MAEAFVHTFKRDYAYVHDRPDAKTLFAQLADWFEDYNERHPPQRAADEVTPRVYPLNGNCRVSDLEGATPLGLPAFNGLFQLFFHKTKVRIDPLPDLWIVGRHLHRHVDAHAPDLAVRSLGIGEHIPKKCFDRVPGSGPLHDALQTFSVFFAVSIKGRQEQGVLVFVLAVQAALVQPGRLHNVLECCSFVSVGPELQQHFLQNLLRIEFLWSCHQLLQEGQFVGLENTTPSRSLDED
jgi:hypothetical protein